MKHLFIPALLLALVFLQSRLGSPAAPETGLQEATTVDVPPSAAPNVHYPSNRSPLAVSPLVKLPVGAVEPRGWLMAQLQPRSVPHEPLFPVRIPSRRRRPPAGKLAEA